MNLHSEEIEASIIGGCLLNPESAILTHSILKVEYLYNEHLKCVYRAITELLKANKDVDVLSVVQELKKQNLLESIGGAYFVTKLTDVASFGAVENHCRIIQQYYILRELVKLSDRLKYKINEPQADCFDILTYLNNEIRNIEAGIQTNKVDNIETIKNDLIKEIRNINESGIPTGIQTSLTLLNNQTNGWQNGNLVVIAARPGMGKTSFALDCVLHPSLNNIPCAFFSLEMTKGELAGKVLASISSMPVQKINNKRLNAYDIDLLERDGQILNGVPLYIDDNTISIEDIKTKARRLKRDYDIKLLCVDYIQLIRGEKGGNRENEISHISRTLKLLAKELNIPILALSQLSRAVELRENKKPQLSDLRESGAIEQDADMVLFLFRPEYYEMPSYQTASGSYDSFQLFIIIIAKYRGGGLGEIVARWLGEITKITNY